MAYKAVIISENKELAEQIMGAAGGQDYDFCYCSTFLEGLDHLVSDRDLAITFIQMSAPWESTIKSLYLTRWVSEAYLVAMLYPGNENDKAHILDIADECMWLPANTDKIASIELQASNRRCSSLTSHSKKEYFYFRGLLVFPIQRRIFFGDRELFPSRIEYELLSYLILHRDSIVSREQLLEKVWHLQYNSENEKTVSVHIHAIRHMLHEVTDEPFIETVRGFGYTFTTETSVDTRRIVNIGKRKKIAT